MSSFYEFVKNDKTIIEIYKQIHEYEDEEKERAYHDLNHVINVAELVKRLLEALNYDKEFIDEAQVAAILHDTGCIKGKEGHPFRSYEYAENYLEKNNIKLKNQEMVLDAIKNHSNGFDTDNIITLTLILADKLDVKKTRISTEGCKFVGNRQFQYVSDINLKIDKHNLKIYFKCDQKINLKELEEYYFTTKIFKAVKTFSKKMNLQPDVFVNNESWKAFYNPERI